MPRVTFPRCGGCGRAAYGRRRKICSKCAKVFHKKCIIQPIQNDHHDLSWQCDGCCAPSGSSTTPSEVDRVKKFSATDLNNRFVENIFNNNGDENETENDLCLDQNDKYYNTDELQSFIDSEYDNGDFFSIFINIRGLNWVDNFPQLECLIRSLPKNPHVIFINETCLKSDEEGSFSNLDGYTFVTNCRSNFECDEVAAYVRNNLKFSVRNDLTIMDEKIFESLFINLHYNR